MYKFQWTIFTLCLGSSKVEDDFLTNVIKFGVKEQKKSHLEYLILLFP